MKSVDLYDNNEMCITKCHTKNETIFHPRLLEFKKVLNDGECAIESRKEYDIDKINLNQNKIMNDYTNCNLNLFDVESEESIMMSYYFNPIFFVKSLYNLKSFDAVIKWTTDNTELPFDTIKRVHNCAWEIFIVNKDNITNSVLNYYYDLAKKQWMKDYIVHINNQISFNIISDNPNDDLSNIIIKTYFDYDFFVSTINKYINIQQKDNTSNRVKQHYKLIKNFVYEQLINKIKNTKNSQH